MLKLLKWIYDLGYKNGWDSAVTEVRKGHQITYSPAPNNGGKV